MVDVNGDRKADYCRAVGEGSGPNSYLTCTLSTGTGLGGDVTVQIDDWGYSDRRWMADFNGDGKADFCRAVGDTSGPNSYLACTFANGSGFTHGIDVMMPMSDWGYSDRRWMVDVNGDGKADYCRAGGEGWGGSSYLVCSLSSGSGFYATSWYWMPDWGDSDKRFWADIDGDHGAEYGHDDSANASHMIFELL
jgi:hypothetical protein